MAVTEKNSFCRPDPRAFLSAGAAVVTTAIAAGDAVAQEPEKANIASASDAGPENEKLREANPDIFLPPSTDYGEVPTFWNSFSTSHRRIEMFKADRFMDLSLSDWMTHAPPALISQHLGISEELLHKLPKEKTVIVPA